MGRVARPRSELRGRRHFQPEFGARHSVIIDNGVTRFFGDLDDRWGEILPDREPDDCKLTGLPERRYSLRNNPLRIGVPIVERHVVSDFARKRRLQWNPNDAGRLKGHLQDQIGRLEISEANLGIALTSAVRVDDGNKGGRFVLRAEQDDPRAKLLVAEHRIVVNGITEVFVDFRYPRQYTPQMTVGHVYRDATAAQVEACEAELQQLIAEQPLTVPLDLISF
jgi:hypothetical protein